MNLTHLQYSGSNANCFGDQIFAIRNGELISAVKAVTIIYTEKGLWLARARAAVRTSPKARYKMTEILLELEDANSQNDLKKIIRIYHRYK